MIGKLAKWAKRQAVLGRFASVKVVLEDGDDDRGVFSDAILREVGQRPILGKKEDYSPFVAGDILAWRHARLLKRRSLVERGHACFVGLFKQLPHDSCHYLSRDETLRMAQQLGIPRL